jgi:D-xylose transport system substrate-binding protein
VLVLQPYVGRSAVALVRKAEADGIPVIAYNDSIPSTRVKAFVGRDNVGVGALIARTGLATTGNRGNWAVVSGEAGGSVADQWTEGVMRTLKPLDKSGRIKLVTQQYLTHWDPERARRLAEDALTKTNNNMQGFLVNNDEMAFGVITALEAQGLAGKVWVGGQDATEQGCRAMLQGTMTASAFTRFDGMGRTAGQLAVQLARGKPLTSDFKFEGVPWFKVESFIVTKRNLVPYLRQYSPQYVNAKHVFRGIPETQWPPGAKALLAKSG